MEYTVCFGDSKANTTVPYSIQRQIGGVAKLPISSFRIELHGQIQGQTKVYKPGQCINGNVIMSNSEDFGCIGMIVSLQGEATTKCQSGSSTRTKSEDLLPYVKNSSEWTSEFLVGNLLDILEFDPCRPKFYIVKKSETEIASPFSLSLRKLNPFPGTFKGTSGEVSYKVIAYVITMRVRNIRAVQQNIIIRGYLNIQAMPNLFSSITVEGEQSSFFHSKKKIRYCLTLTASGYLPGEMIPYNVILYNPQKRNLRKLSVSLVKKITYTSDFTSKCSKTFVASKSQDFIEILCENKWQDFLLVPMDSPTTFEGHTIKLQYFIKVDVFTKEDADSPLMMKGEWPITIGSVREDESLSFENLPLSRALSVMSLTSTTGSSISMPPAYDQILSRASSMETLPPHFDDVVRTERF